MGWTKVTFQHGHESSKLLPLESSESHVFYFLVPNAKHMHFREIWIFPTRRDLGASAKHGKHCPAILFHEYLQRYEYQILVESSCPGMSIAVMPNMYRDAALKSSSLGVVHCRAFPQCRYGARKVSEGKTAKNSYTEFTIKANMKVRHVKKPSERSRSFSTSLSHTAIILQLCSQKAFVVPGSFDRRVALGFFAAGVGLLIFRCSLSTHFPPWHMDQVLCFVSRYF